MGFKRKLELTFFSAIVAGGTMHGVLTAHYGLVSKDAHNICTQELDSYNGTINSSYRSARDWMARTIFNQVGQDEVLPEIIEDCLTPSLLSQASVFWGQNVIDPIINQGNEWWLPEDRTIAERTTEGAQEIIQDTSEGVATRWERATEWTGDQWDNARNRWDNYWSDNDEGDAIVIEPSIPYMPEPQPEPDIETPLYDENGHPIEEETNWLDRTRDALDGINWTFGY